MKIPYVIILDHFPVYVKTNLWGFPIAKFDYRRVSSFQKQPVSARYVYSLGTLRVDHPSLMKAWLALIKWWPPTEFEPPNKCKNWITAHICTCTAPKLRTKKIVELIATIMKGITFLSSWWMLHRAPQTAHDPSNRSPWCPLDVPAVSSWAVPTVEFLTHSKPKERCEVSKVHR